MALGTLVGRSWAGCLGKENLWQVLIFLPAWGIPPACHGMPPAWSEGATVSISPGFFSNFSEFKCAASSRLGFLGCRPHVAGMLPLDAFLSKTLVVACG